MSRKVSIKYPTPDNGKLYMQHVTKLRAVLDEMAAVYDRAGADFGAVALAQIEAFSTYIAGPVVPDPEETE